RRWKSDQIEGQPAYQSFFSSLARGQQAFPFEPGEDEVVDGIADPSRPFDRGQLRPDRLNVGPVPRSTGQSWLVGPNCALIDPRLDSIDLLAAERLATKGHLGTAVQPHNPTHEPAFIGISWNYNSA